MEYTPRGAENDPTALVIQRRQKKFLKQRNIKQRVIALLRKFKPDEEVVSYCNKYTYIFVIINLRLHQLVQILQDLLYCLQRNRNYKKFLKNWEI
jgi:hypothetical protein